MNRGSFYVVGLPPDESALHDSGTRENAIGDGCGDGVNAGRRSRAVGSKNSSPNPVSPAGQGLGLFWTFLIGAAGAACMYLYWFRLERIQKAIASFHPPRQGEAFVQTENGWKAVVPEGSLLLWDLGISILLGGVAALVIATNGTWKEAFLLGCTWNSIFARIAKSGEKGKS